MASLSKKPIVVAPQAKHDSTMVILHGLGDSGSGWLDVAQMLSKVMPHTKFILPTARTRPITLNGGYQMPGWYDIFSLTMRAQEDEPGIKESAAYLRTLIQTEIDAGIPSSRILLGGFSQGASMSLYTGLTTDIKLAGILALSGYFLLRQTITKEQVQALPNYTTPILMCHGEEDEIVTFHMGKASYESIKALGTNTEFKSYANMGHSVCDKELLDIANFVKKTLPPL